MFFMGHTASTDFHAGHTNFRPLLVKYHDVNNQIKILQTYQTINAEYDISTFTSCTLVEDNTLIAFMTENILSFGILETTYGDIEKHYVLSEDGFNI